jgi:Fe-S oxidoreductase
MCPSYRATREERDSTRGRARLLFEMVQGDVITDRWASDAVRESLDTCLSCKGCKSDCPTHTDMASYKAEFLSHYHETRARSRQALFFGLIGRWAHRMAPFARFMNFIAHAPGLAAFAKWIVGVAPQRVLPRFAERSFSASAETIPQNGKFERTVLLWVDTFCEHFEPEIAAAAVKVLNAAGCRALFPPRHLCCGRPLYDVGMLDRAKHELARILDVLEPHIVDGVPIVGLEPSCLSVFKDEMLQLFPGDARARRLAAQTFLFADYLNHIGYQPPALDANVLLHGHCHQKAVFGMTGEVELLNKLGVTYKLLENGCCGMAGGFGFDRRHYEMSQKIGEHELFPALRAVPAETLIVTSGFSCREQIAHGSSRNALHVAELLARALR